MNFLEDTVSIKFKHLPRGLQIHLNVRRVMSGEPAYRRNDLIELTTDDVEHLKKDPEFDQKHLDSKLSS